MKFVIFSLLLVAFVSANVEIQEALENGLHPLSQEMVNMINNAKTTWKVS